MLLFLLRGDCKCVDPPVVSSCSPGFQVGMRDLAAWGRALVSELLLCQVKLRELLIVIHLILIAYFCVLVTFFWL